MIVCTVYLYIATFGANVRFCRMVRDLALVRYGRLLRVGWRDRRDRCAVGERPGVDAGMAGSGRVISGELG